MSDEGPVSEGQPKVDEARIVIRDIFEKCRLNPGDDFGEKNFLRYLMSPPCDALARSWTGTSRKSRFFDLIEKEFRICFPESEGQRNWNFAPFCDWVIERSRKEAVNYKLAKKYLNYNKGCMGFIATASFLIIFYLYISGGKLIYIFIIPIFIVLYFCKYTINFHFHYRKLIKLLEDDC